MSSRAEPVEGAAFDDEGGRPGGAPAPLVAALAGRSPAGARVLVVGNVGNGNTGDEALAAVTLAALATLPGGVRPTLLSRHPARAAGAHGVAAVAMSPTSAARAFAAAHAVVVVGGGMFGPGLPPAVRWLPRVVDGFRRRGRPVAYVGIGVYPGTPPRTLRLLRAAARRGEVTVRDAASAALLGAAAPCVGDLAWRLVPSGPARAAELLGAAGVDLARPMLLLAPKASTLPERTEELLGWMTTATRRWAGRGGTVAAVALSDRTDHGIDTDHSDVALAAAVAAQAGVPVPVLGPDLTPHDAAAVVGASTTVLALRFHGVVFALSAGVPVLAPPWEPKTAALLDDHGLAALTDGVALDAWLALHLPG